MRWVLLLLAGCWTTPAPEPPRAIAPTPLGTCTIRDHDVVAMTAVSLEVAGESFATLDTLSRLEIAVAGSLLGKAQVETELVVLDAELDLTEFQLRPRNPELHDGWIEVHHALLRTTVGSAARLEVELPKGLVPRTRSIEVPCSSLTVEARPPREAPELEVVIVQKSTSLLRTIDGGKLARISIDPDDAENGPIEVEVLDRRRGMLRVRISDPNAVVGWIAESSTSPRHFGPGGGGYGYGIGAKPVMLKCPKRVPIFVRSSSRGVVRVGSLKADREIRIKKTTPDTLEIDLGGGTLAPFVQIADVTACTR
jgi:hypothetical protein